MIKKSCLTRIKCLINEYHYVKQWTNGKRQFFYYTAWQEVHKAYWKAMVKLILTADYSWHILGTITNSKVGICLCCSPNAIACTLRGFVHYSIGYFLVSCSCASFQLHDFQIVALEISDRIYSFCIWSDYIYFRRLKAILHFVMYFFKGIWSTVVPWRYHT